MMNNLLKKYLLSLLCSLSISAFLQEKFTLNGYLTDGETGETLIGASVFVQELGIGTTINEYGFYSISIPSGTYTIEFRYIGFSNKIESMNLTQNIKLDIDMGGNVEDLVEVVVTSVAEDRNVSDLEMSTNKLDAATIKKIPSLLGEVEIIRSLQLSPGVSTVGEGATGFIMGFAGRIGIPPEITTFTLRKA